MWKSPTGKVHKTVADAVFDAALTPLGMEALLALVHGDLKEAVTKRVFSLANRPNNDTLELLAIAGFAEIPDAKSKTTEGAQDQPSA